MSTVKTFDLETFFRGEDIDLANLAAQLMTERTEADDSVWVGSSYGSALESLLPRAGGEELVRREVLRCLDVVGLTGEVSVTTDGEARIRFADVELSVTTSGVTA
jgi:hypothetical protein